MTHKHYSYLQRLSKEKVLLEVIKMSSWMAWVQRLSGLIEMREGEKALWRVEELLRLQ